MTEEADDPTVRLFHGTTSKAAIAIREDGLVAYDQTRIEAEAHEIGARYGLDGEDLLARAATWTHEGLTRQGQEHVYFTGEWMTAVSYAARGSEIVWELVLTVWRLQHDDVRPGREADEWARTQLDLGQPMVVTVEAPFVALVPHLRPRRPQPGGNEWTPAMVADEWDLFLPSPVDRSWIVDVSPAPRVLKLPEIAALLGTDLRTLSYRLRKGEMPSSTNGKPALLGGEWTESDIRPWLAEQGVPI